MLKFMLNIRDGIDLMKFLKLVPFLKKKSVDYQAKKYKAGFLNLLVFATQFSITILIAPSPPPVLKSRIFSELCKDMAAVHSASLFYCKARWFSRGIFLQCVQKSEPEAEKFRNDLFVSSLVQGPRTKYLPTLDE
jgi:hypothetical protein